MSDKKLKPVNVPGSEVEQFEQRVSELCEFAFDSKSNKYSELVRLLVLKSVMLEKHDLSQYVSRELLKGEPRQYIILSV